ncbi:unnamed protein product [Phaedon cochleariae]|uniref:Uncharacterized protein n=1 Tax=Phaedon cochleariae TaxID=80249 RepID=A0A9N9SJR6_PHACE|nr:unnamed protein product [Phaedon cochleariae]
MKSELSPEAPVYIPPPLRNVTPKSSPPQKSNSGSKEEEAQCSRYSRKSIRSFSLSPNSPRPILGNKLPFPRPILGKRDDPERDEAVEYIGREFRRSFSRMRQSGQSLLRRRPIKPNKRDLVDMGTWGDEDSPIRSYIRSDASPIGLASRKQSFPKNTTGLRNCVQCKQMFGPYFQGRACGEACLVSNGQITPDCNNPGTLGNFLKRLY